MIKLLATMTSSAGAMPRIAPRIRTESTDSFVAAQRFGTYVVAHRELLDLEQPVAFEQERPTVLPHPPGETNKKDR